MDATHGTGTVARRDHGVELLVSVIDYLVVIVETNSANHSRVIGHFGSSIRFVNLLNVIYSFCRMEVAVDNTHVRFSSQFAFLRLYFQPFYNIRRMCKLNTTVLPYDSFDILIKFDVISVDYGSFRLPPLRANIGFVTLRSIRAGTLASLGLDVIVLWMLGLRIINISNSQSDSTHPYNSIFFKLETLRFICFFRIFAYNVPKLFFRIRVDCL